MTWEGDVCPFKVCASLVSNRNVINDVLFGYIVHNRSTHLMCVHFFFFVDVGFFKFLTILECTCDELSPMFYVI